MPEEVGKYNNPVCAQCHANFPQVYHACHGKFCDQLLMWVQIEAQHDPEQRNRFIDAVFNRRR